AGPAALSTEFELQEFARIRFEWASYCSLLLVYYIRRTVRTFYRVRAPRTCTDPTWSPL
ncbi:hypothetical protein FIBSPDRAFT_860381, partial [Athelia psychrophila]